MFKVIPCLSVLISFVSVLSGCGTEAVVTPASLKCTMSAVSGSYKLVYKADPDNTCGDFDAGTDGAVSAPTTKTMADMAFQAIPDNDCQIDHVNAPTNACTFDTVYFCGGVDGVDDR